MRKLFVLAFLFAHGLQAQVLNFEPRTDVEFIVSSKTLTFPTFGGLNYAQFADMDIDFDGDLDLVVFDRQSNNILALRQIQPGGIPKYEQVRNAKRLFPNDVIYRLQLYDYNNDGKKDLFTYGVGGVKAYKNVGSASQGLVWELSKELLFSKYPNNVNNLYVSLTDMPALVDVEGDGDMDILTFNIGGEHLEYHQNQSMDLYGHADSLVFELRNECWGKFSEDPNNSTILLNDPDAPCVGGQISNPEFDDNSKSGLHSGSSVLALDLNGDQVLDLILGDISSKSLTKLRNGGSAPNTNSAMVEVETNFPQNSTAVELDIFPAPFFVDVDFDGIKDLVVGANGKNVSENIESVWFYKNTGSNSVPQFVFQTKSFLQNEMIDVGTGSIPVFFDQNGDGKDDLLLANFYKYIPSTPNKLSNISIYRNTSSAGNTSFTYLDDDFLNLSLENFGLRTLPSFGDVNGDGKKDLLLSLESGNFRLYINSTISGNASFIAPSGLLKNSANETITEGNYPYGQLFDLNNDGLTDIIVGKKNGLLVYYKNVGTSTAPSFEKVNDQLGNIDVSGAFPDGYPVPHFFRLDGVTYLFLGSLQGKLRFYRGIDGKLQNGDSFELYQDDFLQTDLLGYSSFYVNDIDQDGFLDLWAGNDLGGLYHFEVDPNSSSSLKENTLHSLKIYPNPSKGTFQIDFKDLAETQIKVYDIKGLELSFNLEIQSSKGLLSLNQATNGIYFLEITDKTTGAKRVERIQVIR